ncbi:Undecaprenyl-diphosphatase [Desulfovibrio sp. X2]|uniref:undecaprenyl-diphosphate phosphatase n=1 Tax=Desulfovibrio sp. X2 TaxID=941449 RepID=UPI000358F4DA|nr:undecaprenyl-diphosphate phosphatase [Desulfovibrio sp. X2]EPR42271.1 Undecaprenyl-diphosphatase [Desulfovibrio sp. X2]
MSTILSASILGVVEGLTEFLPVSSTGHLILTSSLLGLSGAKIDAFEVIIQLGAILAVVVIYWQRFRGLVLPERGQAFSGVRGLWLLFLTSLPASVIGLLTHKFIETKLFNPHSVAISLAVGAVLILLVEGRKHKPRLFRIDNMTSGFALAVGMFQCLALWPGFSRSAATIMGGMICGADRMVAAEYSFVAAVPIMIAATGYKLYKTWALYTSSDLVFLAVGFVVAFFAAWAAVKCFIGLLQRWTLRPFAVYRLILAPLVILFWPS